MEILTFEIYTDNYSVIVQAPTIEGAISLFKSDDTNDGQAIVCVYDCSKRDAQYLERRQHLLKLMERQTDAWIRADSRRNRQAELFDE